MPGGDFAHNWDESESVQFAHARKHVFALRGTYNRYANRMRNAFYFLSILSCIQLATNLAFDGHII